MGFFVSFCFDATRWASGTRWEQRRFRQIDLIFSVNLPCPLNCSLLYNITVASLLVFFTLHLLGIIMLALGVSYIVLNPGMNIPISQSILTIRLAGKPLLKHTPTRLRGQRITRIKTCWNNLTSITLLDRETVYHKRKTFHPMTSVR